MSKCDNTNITLCAFRVCNKKSHLGQMVKKISYHIKSHCSTKELKIDLVKSPMNFSEHFKYTRGSSHMITILPGEGAGRFGMLN